MKFVDEAIIEVQSGKGGSGASHFRREKFVPFGGPDGGNGGRGGSVILQADRNRHTLLDFQFQPVWRAEDGNQGAGSLKEGKSAEDITINLPIGTEIYDQETGKLLCDLSEDKQTFVVAKGGRGGKGNDFFKSATNQAPTHSQPGEEGVRKKIRLNLKLVADVGIIGLPNAGKSTLISRISAARPKIADYPFTTLTPNLGVVRGRAGRSFVIADIPGLVSGASSGRGLGIKFLKHVERTKVLLHLIDPNSFREDGRPYSAEDAFKEINEELRSFSPELADKEQIVAISKVDTILDTELQNEIAKLFPKNQRIHFFSSVTGSGVQELIDLVEKRVKELD